MNEYKKEQKYLIAVFLLWLFLTLQMFCSCGTPSYKDNAITNCRQINDTLKVITSTTPGYIQQAYFADYKDDYLLVAVKCSWIDIFDIFVDWRNLPGPDMKNIEVTIDAHDNAGERVFYLPADEDALNTYLRDYLLYELNGASTIHYQIKNNLIPIAIRNREHASRLLNLYPYNQIEK